MKKLLFCLLLSVSALCYSTEDGIVMPILGIVDGDTIKSEFSGLPSKLSQVSVRIYGIDTPEKGNRAKCNEEHELATKATEHTTKIIGNRQIMTIYNPKWDKYGGRIDAVVFVNGVNLGKSLIDANLAKPYFGEKKGDWCNNESK
jgi:micrococcal nuclease